MDAIFARRSIRKYTPEPVTPEEIESLLRAAMAAPSAHNLQPWHFVVVTESATLDAIPEFHRYARMLHEAPLAILVCGDEEATAAKPHPRWVQDCSAATQNILLAATDLGLGSVWLGIHPDPEYARAFAELLGLPDHITAFSMIAIGHPVERKGPSERYDESRVHLEKW